MEYSEKVMDRFTNPSNMGEIKDADGIGKVGDPKCGDIMWIYIKVNDDEIITDCKFKTFGCVSAIATSDMVADLVKGKNIDEALKVTNKEVAEALDGLPDVKMHCSVLAEEGIEEAIKNYKNNK